jgi:hypothetical protein
MTVAKWWLAQQLLGFAGAVITVPTMLCVIAYSTVADASEYVARQLLRARAARGTRVLQRRARS